MKVQEYFNKTKNLKIVKQLYLHGTYKHGLTVLLGMSMLTFWTFKLLTKPYIIDEAQFPYAAEAVANTGIPLYYKSDLEMAVGIWHSPFYTYSLGYWMRMWGTSTVSVRTYGLFCLILSCFVIYMAIKKINSKNQNSLAPYIGTLFYLSHYLVIQDALIPDIDGTILPLAFLIAVYFLICVGKRELSFKKELLYTSISLGFAFSTKLTTPFVLVPTMFIFFMIAKNSFITSLMKTLGYTALGQLVFLTWWIPLAKFSNLDWKFPYIFTIRSFNDKNSSDSLTSIIMSGISMNSQVKLWIGLPTIILLSLLFLIGKKLVNRNDLLIYYTIATLSIIIWFVYNFVSGPPFGFAKYWNIPIALIAILVGWSTNNFNDYALLQNKLSKVLPIIMLTIIFISYKIYKRVEKFENLDALYSSKISIFLSVYLFLLFLFIATRKNVILSFTLVAIIVVMTYNISISNALALNKNSSSYYFGESGLEEVIYWLKNNVQKDDLIFAPKDVGLQVGSRYYEDAILLLTYDPLGLAEFVKSNNVKYIIVRNKFEYSVNAYSESFEGLNKYYSKVVLRIGDFQIWGKAI